MRAASIKKVIIYECGCVAQYEVISEFSAMKRWHIVPCCNHHKEIIMIENQSEHDWMNIVREFLNEHDCILYLREKGYQICTMS